MLAFRVVQLIRNHRREIVDRAIRQIREEPELRRLQALPRSDLAGLAQAVIQDLESGTELEEVSRRYELRGRRAWAESVPMHEYVRGLQLLHYALVDFARTQAVPRTPVEIYSQEDLEERLCHIFDRIAYHFIRGYELGQAASRPAA